MKLKFCGICREQDVQYVNEVKPDFAGFVFAKSKRQITWETAKKFRRQMDPQIRTVGVFVNEKTDVILSYLQEKIIDFVQLHGDETNEQILEIKEKTGATTRCRPFEQKELGHVCVHCGKPAKDMYYFARAY